MELCEHYLHYMSALCEGTMPAPPELALTADTTEERAAQLQSALKDLSVPDFVRLCAKSAGDELDEAIFDHFSEEDFLPCTAANAHRRGGTGGSRGKAARSRKYP